MSEDIYDAPDAGGIPYAVGQASKVRIPIPGMLREGICIEFSPRGRIPSGGSTSTLFFQEITGRKSQLRLDYGYNPSTKTVDYHWNQNRAFSKFGIPDHTPVGRAGKIAYKAAKYFRVAGRVFFIAGASIDIASIAMASQPLRRASEVVSGWALAWAGCKVVGAGGAALATPTTPLGMAAAGAAGCIIGGIGGYYAGSAIGGAVFDWAEGTLFFPVPEVPPP